MICIGLPSDAGSEFHRFGNGQPGRNKRRMDTKAYPAELLISRHLFSIREDSCFFVAASSPY